MQEDQNSPRLRHRLARHSVETAIADASAQISQQIAITVASLDRLATALVNSTSDSSRSIVRAAIVLAVLITMLVFAVIFAALQMPHSAENTVLVLPAAGTATPQQHGTLEATTWRYTRAFTKAADACFGAGINKKCAPLVLRPEDWNDERNTGASLLEYLRQYGTPTLAVVTVGYDMRPDHTRSGGYDRTNEILAQGRAQFIISHLDAEFFSAGRAGGACGIPQMFTVLRAATSSDSKKFVDDRTPRLITITNLSGASHDCK